MSQIAGVAQGDVIVVHRHAADGQHRIGEVLEVMGSGEHRRLRVQWDGHESIFFPAEDVTVELAGAKRDAH